MDELKAMIQKMDTKMNQFKQDIDAARLNPGFQDQKVNINFRSTEEKIDMMEEIRHTINLIRTCNVL